MLNITKSVDDITEVGEAAKSSLLTAIVFFLGIDRNHFFGGGGVRNIFGVGGFCRKEKNRVFTLCFRCNV